MIGDTESLWSWAGQQCRHQRLAEVCDGECSWCLGAGQSDRKGFPLPHNIDTQEHAVPSKPSDIGRQNAHNQMKTQNTNISISTKQFCVQFLQINHNITLRLSHFFIFCLIPFIMGFYTDFAIF